MPFPTHIVATGGFIEDEQGNILLVKTRDGGWVYLGGQVEVGENLIDGLIREIKEESGIAGVYSNTGIFKWYGGELLAVTEETTDSRWVAKDKVLDFIENPAIQVSYAGMRSSSNTYVQNTSFVKQTQVSKTPLSVLSDFTVNSIHTHHLYSFLLSYLSCSMIRT
ncbi:hypothetical protein BBD41_00115 [Paenibacillus ihbetae]|uniref:Nudix hydrolase domain-containing protein n=1 Tax=Paenibacillus ihbetae TaxID=1870820 RepID=A0A1B2DTT6_9BACL|nr:NUDIX hydrolase [Paenibacillus ihbetae]ANY71126.1 hypothetical protein BBD41_00115 [Paenibacillus ihbetae]